ncbi:hypothetical protein WK91_18200 [Burkholderia cepacia]|nr:hypothetical protein WK91_18200 [Burkholderia cepacia]
MTLRCARAQREAEKDAACSAAGRAPQGMNQCDAGGCSSIAGCNVQRSSLHSFPAVAQFSFLTSVRRMLTVAAVFA